MNKKKAVEEETALKHAPMGMVIPLSD
jgi:hypothetical protein